MNKPFYEKPHGNYYVGDMCTFYFPVHIHEVVEIVYVTEGNLIMNLDGEERMLLPGDCAIAFPEVLHGYEQASENAKGMCVAMIPTIINEFNTLFHTMKPVSPVIRIDREDEEMQYAIRKLKALSEQKDNDRMIIAYMHLFVACLLSRMDLQPLNKTMEKGLVYDVLQYIAQHFRENLTLETTARALGISNSHLSHLFSQNLHINFRRYLNVIRIEHACLLLQDPHNSISEIAEACGYECNRTFHRAFMEEYKMKPNEYRAQVVKGWRRAENENVSGNNANAELEADT